MRLPLSLIALLPAVHAACAPPPDVTWDTVLDPFSFSLSTTPKSYIEFSGSGSGLGDQNLVRGTAASAGEFGLDAGVPVSGRRHMVISTQLNSDGTRRLFMTTREQSKPEFVASLVCDGDRETWSVKFTPRSNGVVCLKGNQVWWKPAGVVASGCVDVQLGRDNGLKEVDG